MSEFNFESHFENHNAYTCNYCGTVVTGEVYILEAHFENCDEAWVRVVILEVDGNGLYTGVVRVDRILKKDYEDEAYMNEWNVGLQNEGGHYPLWLKWDMAVAIARKVPYAEQQVNMGITYRGGQP